MNVPDDATPRERGLFVALAERDRQIAELAARVAELQAKLARANRNSSNSSRPPSSDIVKPSRPVPLPGEPRRKTGGQPGHEKHERAAFPPKQVDKVLTYDHQRRQGECGGRPPR